MDSLENIKESIAQANEEAVLADGFEDALVGYVEVFGKTIALYDKEKCLQILMKRDKMDRDGALDFFEFNVQGSYVGESTPAFATILRR